MSSHLDMVHQLSATEPTPYLKCAVVCPSEIITRPTEANDKKHRIYHKQSRNSLTQSKLHRWNTNPYKCKRVCPICQRPNVIHMSSHLDMVHQLSATEPTPYLKCAVVCPSEIITRPTEANDKKHRIYNKQSRNSLTQSKLH